MGIDTESARFLLGSRHEGASFQRCATLGRQSYFVGNRETAALLREYDADPNQYPKLFSPDYGRYSEPFWEMLGARELEIIDASDFEGGPNTRVHDLNFPVPDELKGRYDAVCDLGTLEHVFNYPTGICNCLEMVKVGGHFFSQCPANNYFGHGFYQFSPELFFRILSKKNGFQMERMVAVEYGPRRRWYAVADPNLIEARVSLINCFPVMLFVRAAKIATVPLLREVPQEFGCASLWVQPTGQGAPPKLQRLKQALVETTPGLARFLEAFKFSSFSREWSLRNRRSFTPLRKREWGKRA